MKAEWPKRLEYKSFLYFGTFYSPFHIARSGYSQRNVITERDGHNVTLEHNNRSAHASQCQTHCLY